MHDLKSDIARLQDTLSRVERLLIEGAKEMPNPLPDEWSQNFADQWIEWAGRILNTYDDRPHTKENVNDSVAALVSVIIGRLIETKTMVIQAMMSGGSENVYLTVYAADVEFTTISMFAESDSIDALSKVVDSAKGEEDGCVEMTFRIGTPLDIDRLKL